MMTSSNNRREHSRKSSRHSTRHEERREHCEGRHERSADEESPRSPRKERHVGSKIHKDWVGKLHPLASTIVGGVDVDDTPPPFAHDDFERGNSSAAPSRAEETGGWFGDLVSIASGVTNGRSDGDDEEDKDRPNSRAAEGGWLSEARASENRQRQQRKPVSSSGRDRGVNAGTYQSGAPMTLKPKRMVKHDHRGKHRAQGSLSVRQEPPCVMASASSLKAGSARTSTRKEQRQNSRNSECSDGMTSSFSSIESVSSAVPNTSPTSDIRRMSDYSTDDEYSEYSEDSASIRDENKIDDFDSSVETTPASSVASDTDDDDDDNESSRIEIARRYFTALARRTDDAEAHLRQAQEELESATRDAARAEERRRLAERRVGEAREQKKVVAEEGREAQEFWLGPSANIAVDTKILAAARVDIDSNAARGAAAVISATASFDRNGTGMATNDSLPSATVAFDDDKIRIQDGTWGRGSYHGDVNAATGKPDGVGVVEWDDSNCRYTGNWSRGRMHGQGVMAWPTGAGGTYDGMWAYGECSGRGKFTWPDGSSYDGDWHLDQKHGWGTYRYSDGEEWQGEWVEDRSCGSGTYRYLNGDALQGQWVDFVCMVGTCRFADGAIEIGRYNGDKPSDVKVGVRWSADRKTLWRMENGEKKCEIAQAEAMDIVRTLGPIDLSNNG